MKTKQTPSFLFVFLEEKMTKTWWTSEETECLLAWYQLKQEKAPMYHLGDKVPSWMSGSGSGRVLLWVPSHTVLYSWPHLCSYQGSLVSPTLWHYMSVTIPHWASYIGNWPKQKHLLPRYRHGDLDILVKNIEININEKEAIKILGEHSNEYWNCPCLIFQVLLYPNTKARRR